MIKFSLKKKKDDGDDQDPEVGKKRSFFNFTYLELFKDKNKNNNNKKTSKSNNKSNNFNLRNLIIPIILSFMSVLTRNYSRMKLFIHFWNRAHLLFSAAQILANKDKSMDFMWIIMVLLANFHV
jgi:hypothetical protein